MDKLLLVDGNSIMNRAFYGVPDLTNSSGMHTNAVYGFLNIIFKFIDEEKPTHMAVAFDLHAPTFRHKMYPEYKGTRKGMPEELRMQVPYIKDIVKCLNIAVVEKEGYEADDILGTLAKKAQDAGMEAVIVSGDRDLLQVSDRHIKIRIPKTIKGQTTVEDYYPEQVMEKYNVTPKEFIELKALMGDSSDNIPGVPKVGEKTAQELITAYHSIEGIYEHIDELKKASVKQSFLDNRELADLCLKLVTINIDAPINLDFSNYLYDVKFTEEGLNIVKQLSLKTYIKKFEDNLTGTTVSEFVLPEYRIIDNFVDASGLENILLNSKILSFVETPFGTGILSDSEYYFVKGITFFDKDLFLDKNFDSLKGVILTEEASSFFKNIKDNHLKNLSRGITEKIFAFDLAGYLLNPLNNNYDLESLSNDYLQLGVPKEFSEEKDIIKVLCIRKSLYEVLSKLLTDTEQDDLYKNIEMPLSLVLYEMEKDGIAVDTKALREYGAGLADSITTLEKQIYEEAGHEFNILSPKQLGVVLFEEMNLPSGKKTKTGYSTNADILNKLAEDYPFVQKILDYRTYTKLKSTYAEGLLSAVSEDGRIHSHFLQTVTATGRISSAEPNLQNIPIKTELGRELRKVFVPKVGCFFADADYSQIELRVLAHLSNDSFLTDAFNNGEDIHSVTASAVFGVNKDEVTPLMRRTAKVVNFGIIYGMSSFSLGQDLKISKKEADEYIEGYFAKYPGIKKYLDDCVKWAMECGFSVTALKRRRPIPELKAAQFMQKEFGKRVAMNAPVQGTAADIMKLAMINVRDALLSNNLESRILIQVHDELLLEVKADEKDKALNILKEEMEKAYKMCVPLLVDLQTGDNWYEAK